MGEKRNEGQGDLANLASLWPLRLEHDTLLNVVKKLLRIAALPKVNNAATKYDAYTKAKFQKQFSESLTKNTRVCSLHANVKGAVETWLVDESKHFHTVDDKHSRFVFVRPHRAETQASLSLLQFIKRFKKQSGHTVRSDYFVGEGVLHQARTIVEADGEKVAVASLYTSQSNRLARRYHGIISSLARTCLKQAKL